ncbi:uncharacterized protein LOC133496941 isoform X4 [Syngnathoides biaculeatus]|uniref:uncharacterized protein LOC133496941 isoform X4 n=1 Tax=Syngnathoides biaculeatus TaxID=300417 RepID=UPI002ADDDE4A|nr:uncharacterized protein LOC133496941 isoform X4 [Syngnathoides biaculeatus]
MRSSEMTRCGDPERDKPKETHTVEFDYIYTTLVHDLVSAAFLAALNYIILFHLDVTVTPTIVNATLYQMRDGERHVSMYFSIILDPLETKSPECTRFGAGVAKVIQKNTHMVMSYPLVVLTDHLVTAYVASSAFRLSSPGQTRLLKILTAPNITYVHTGINITDELHVDPHCCEIGVTDSLRPHADLSVQPLTNARVLFTDGCCNRKQDGCRTGAAALRSRTLFHHHPLHLIFLSGHLSTLNDSLNELAIYPEATPKSAAPLCLQLHADQATADARPHLAGNRSTDVSRLHLTGDEITADFHPSSTTTKRLRGPVGPGCGATLQTDLGSSSEDTAAHEQRLQVRSGPQEKGRTRAQVRWPVPDFQDH